MGGGSVVRCTINGPSRQWSKNGLDIEIFTRTRFILRLVNGTLDVLEFIGRVDFDHFNLTMCVCQLIQLFVCIAYIKFILIN